MKFGVIGVHEGRRGCLATVQQVYMSDLRKGRKKEVQDIGYAMKEKDLENICEGQLHLLAQRVRGGVLTCDVAHWRVRCCLMGVNQGAETLAEVSSYRRPHMDVDEG